MVLGLPRTEVRSRRLVRRLGISDGNRATRTGAEQATGVRCRTNPLSGTRDPASLAGRWLELALTCLPFHEGIKFLPHGADNEAQHDNVVRVPRYGDEVGNEMTGETK